MTSTPPPRLCLLPPEDGFTGQEISCGTSGITQRLVEGAGHAYARWQDMDFRGSSPKVEEAPAQASSEAASAAGQASPLRVHARPTPATPPAAPVEDSPVAPSPPSSAASPPQRSTRKGAIPAAGAAGSSGALPHTPVGEDGEYDYAKQNHYAVLGLGHLGATASDEQIKRAHRKLLLKLHPDKRGMSVEEATKDPLFLSVQKAHEVLGNDERRKQYDSAFEFDDSIPDADEEGDFFEVYGPVFAANARFSTVKPVPLLGDAGTPWETVDAFYRFWFVFSSWREADFEDEYDLEEATCREEKRWMKQQNDKARKKWKKEEVKRVQTLVNRSFNRDPRVAAHKAEEEAAAAAVAERKAAAAAAAKAAKREAAAAAEREAEAAAAAEAELKLALRGARTLLKRLWKRGFTEDCGAPRNGAALLLDRLEDEDVIALAGQVASAAGQGFDRGNTSAGGVEVAELSTAQAAAGTAVVVQAVQTLQGEIAAATKAAAAKREARAAEAAAAKAAATTSAPWTAQELSFLAKGISKYPGGTRNRWQVVADYINTLGLKTRRSKEDCIAKAHALMQEQASAGNKVQGGSTAAAASGGQSAPPAWSAAQQSALEGALRKYPASMDKKERWRAIAAAVEGKTAKQCALRYKELRAAVQARK